MHTSARSHVGCSGILHHHGLLPIAPTLALLMPQVSGKPIKFVGVGEKMDALEPFYPERMAQRILGMGDMLTLYEKAQEAIKVRRGCCCCCLCCCTCCCWEQMFASMMP